MRQGEQKMKILKNKEAGQTLVMFLILLALGSTKGVRVILGLLNTPTGNILNLMKTL